MSALQKYENLSIAARNAVSDIYASYFEPSDTPPHAGDSSNSSQSPKHLGLDLICHLHGGQLAAITSIFVNREVIAFRARASGDEMLETAALDGDGIEPDGFKAATFIPFKVSKIKADTGASLIAATGLRTCSPSPRPIQSRFLGREAVNDNHWRAAA